MAAGSRLPGSYSLSRRRRTFACAYLSSSLIQGWPTVERLALQPVGRSAISARSGWFSTISDIATTGAFAGSRGPPSKKAHEWSSS